MRPYVHKILALIAMSLALFSSCKYAPETAEERPNILFIIADDLGDRLACYGDTVAQTPHLDKLAGKGVVFRNTFCQYPTCGPSRASMFSGLYPFETGYTSNRGDSYNELLPGTKSLPRLLREHGYFTARVGKLFHMGIPGGIGEAGTDDTLAWDVAVNNSGWDAIEKNWEAAQVVGNEMGPGVRIRYSSPDIEDRGMADGQGLEEAISILKENHPDKSGKPFFLAYGLYRPHPPMIVPRKHWDAIDISKFDIPLLPENDREDIPDINWHLKGPGFNFIAEEEGRNYAHAYYAAIHFVDELSGKLIAALEQEGLSENTIIVFTGDQGFMLGEHGHWHKSSMFEESCRVPLIIVDPRQKERGKQCHGPAGLIDLYPTLCELTGISPSHKLSGRSLAPQLKDPGAEGKICEYTMGTPNAYGIRTTGYRYTEWREDGIHASFSMLYDLEADPGEFTNLAGNLRYQSIQKELKRKLDSVLIGD